MTTYWLLGRADCPDNIMPMSDTPEAETQGDLKPELPGEIQPYDYTGGGDTTGEVRNYWFIDGEIEPYDTTGRWRHHRGGKKLLVHWWRDRALRLYWEWRHHRRDKKVLVH